MNTSKSKLTKRIPTYVWAIVLLIGGLIFGGQFPNLAAPIVNGTELSLKRVITPFVIPVLIILALCPSIASLIERGKSGRFAASGCRLVCIDLDNCRTRRLLCFIYCVPCAVCVGNRRRSF